MIEEGYSMVDMNKNDIVFMGAKVVGKTKLKTSFFDRLTSFGGLKQFSTVLLK